MAEKTQMHAYPLNSSHTSYQNGRAGIHIMIGNTKFAGTGAVPQCPAGKINHPFGETETKNNALDVAGIITPLVGLCLVFSVPLHKNACVMWFGFVLIGVGCATF